MTPRLLTLLALVAGLLALGAGPAPAAAPYTSWSLRAEPDDFYYADHVYGPESAIRVEGDRSQVTVSVGQTSLDLAAPNGGVLTAGTTYSGTSSYPFGTGSGAKMSLDTESGNHCPQETGEFTVREITTDLSGRVTALNVVYVLRCSAASVPASRGSLAVNSTIPPVLLAPTMWAEVRHEKVPHRGEALVVVRLSADAPSHEVGIFLSPEGQPETLIATGTVVGNERVKIPIKPHLSGVITVRWSGGGQFPDLAVTGAVTVGGKVVSRLRGGRGKQGRAHLVPASRDATLVAAVLPAVHKGACLRFQAQYFVRGFWGYDATVKCVKLDKNSAGAVRIPGDRRLVGVPIRVRALWRGDALNTEAKGKWQYLRFTGGGGQRSATRLPQQPDRLRPHAVQAGQVAELLR